jgi:hypothetical protein
MEDQPLILEIVVAEEKLPDTRSESIMAGLRK